MELICCTAELDGVRIHNLRHSFASVGEAGNVGLPVIGTLLGHRSPDITQRYAHLADSPLRVAADRIAGMIAASLDGTSSANTAYIWMTRPPEEKQTCFAAQIACGGAKNWNGYDLAVCDHFAMVEQAALMQRANQKTLQCRTSKRARAVQARQRSDFLDRVPADRHKYGR